MVRQNPFLAFRESALQPLRERAERAQREGDMETASRVLFADIPSIEHAFSVWILHRLKNGSLVIQDERQEYLATPIDAVDVNQLDANFQEVAQALPESISPKDTLEWLHAKASELVSRGDYQTASEIEADLMPEYERWVDDHRVFGFEAETPAGRLVLKDESGDTWIAVRAGGHID